MEEKVVSIDRLAFGGEGVGRVEGKVVFVPFTTPGDKVKFRVTEESSRYDRGEVVELLTPSENRTTPRCSVFGTCGGCQWQHIDYGFQLKVKEEILRETLQRIGGIKDPAILPIIPSPKPWNYRHRIQLKKDSKGRIGFLKSGDSEVVEFERCEIAEPILSEKVRALRGEGKGIPPAFELVAEGGEATLREMVDPDRLFSQVNLSLNGKLVETVLEMGFGRAEIAFTKKWNAVELYSGEGNFTFSLAERVGQLFVVEESARAIAQAIKRAKERGVADIEFIRGTAEWGLKKVMRRGEPVDLVVLDPPRRGAKEILDLLFVVKPRIVVYVSCDPSTLARDLKVLTARHFLLESIQPLDMFPQTYHIEAVAKLVRRNGT